mmetsp:Transcript_51336/g.154240  ORF Transcript_51336/g.154240 Transcript_51336/m.154240 type:complete len:358 (-) Transcript_51336:597-1670(-)
MAAFWDPSRPDDGPPPKISQNRVLVIGFLVFILASVWPPLILLVTFFLSMLIPYTFRVNDDGESRRKFHREFEQRKNTPKMWRNNPDDIVMKERYWVNDRGMCLLTTTMEPAKASDIKAVVCLCHGYGDNVSYLKRVEYRRYVRAGIAVVMIEYEGHGRSDGLIGMTPRFDSIIDDVSSFFEEVTEKKYPGKKRFLVGESMGGAVAMLTHNRKPALWTGVVFICPMCKVSDNMLPPDWVITTLRKILGPSGHFTALGSLPIAPAKGNTANESFRLEGKKRLFTMHPFVYGRKPRLDTAREIIDVTGKISGSLIKEFNAPFLVQHGSADKVGRIFSTLAYSRWLPCTYQDLMRMVVLI